MKKILCWYGVFIVGCLCLIFSLSAAQGQKNVVQEFERLQQQIAQWSSVHSGELVTWVASAEHRLEEMFTVWKSLHADLQRRIARVQKRHQTTKVAELLQQQNLYESQVSNLFFVQRKELLFRMSEPTAIRVRNLQETPLVFDNDAAAHATDVLESDGVKQVLNFYGVRVFVYENQYFLLSNLWSGTYPHVAPFEEGYLACTTQKYRIMLMPLLEKIPLVLVYFFNALQKDPALRSLIARVSLINNFEQRNQLPVITIYATQGHESAQQLLDKILQIFKVSPGLDQPPQWGDKITPLVYVTQGDDEQRLLPEYEHKFIMPHRAYFVDDVTGNTCRYQLVTGSLSKIGL